MTLRRKMGLQITAMIVGLLLISGASLLGLKGMQEDYGAALQGIQQLRQTYEVASHLGIAKATLQESARPNVASAINQVQRAITKFEATDPWPGDGAVSYEMIRHGLHDAMSELRLWQSVGGSPEAASSKVDVGVYNEIRETASNVKERIEAIQAAAQVGRRSTLTTLAMICAAVIMASVLLGMWQYSGVFRPLHRLTGAVRRVSRGQFGVRILEGGMPSGDDNEFARLAADFNRMAEQLDGFYKNLEEKVAAKSKELIRSERLASVGYLAAGVAHEINNPLGIISGYAEYALSEMKSRGMGSNETNAGRAGVSTDLDIDATLKVIRDEAFRCKDITSKLLSLARPGEANRQRIDLAVAAESVVSALGGLKHFKDRTITVRAEAAEPLVVDAVEGEMKQVIMNLLINALEATDDGTGEVRVTLAHGGPDDRDDRSVQLTVSDNGRGMTPETLERVFEPFFTDRPRAPGSPPRPGTGLGLSITHAIVQSHGGRITAYSDGPGLGSRFVMEIPAAQGAAEPA